MASAWIWVIGSILQCASQNRGMLVAGRVISGMSIGLASSCVPLYQSEITNHNIRGRVVSLQQWAITWSGEDIVLDFDRCLQPLSAGVFFSNISFSSVAPTLTAWPPSVFPGVCR